MTITAGELGEIREIIGAASPPSDSTLEEYFDELGTTTLVARRVVRQRLADMRAKATKFTAEGDFSEDWTETIKALERLEKNLSTTVAAAGVTDSSTGDVTTGLLVRQGRSR